MKYGKLLFVSLFFSVFVAAASASAQTTVDLSATFTGTQACGNADVISVKKSVFLKVTVTSVSIYTDSNFSNLYVSLSNFAVYDSGPNTFAVASSFSGAGFDAILEGMINTSSKKFGVAGVYVDFNDNTGCFLYGSVKSTKVIGTYP